jgi:class 3 adenylate cyclase/tetratricopeptide (TPR) repeat protein
VRCTACGAENPAGAKFCNECATPLATSCPTCGTANPPTAKFCSECATQLGGAPQVRDGAQPQRQPPGARPDDAVDGTVAVPVSERRLVSVLFADLVGFTPFAEERDAEEVRETLTRYFDMARDTVERYGGTVEKFIGDAVMAVWGVPTAHEDDAERAVRAALDLVSTVPRLGSGVEARAGVLTGEAAVTLGATGQGMVAGDIVNTAARLQSVAAPSTVLVGEGTQRASEAAVAYEVAGEQTLKGKSAPVPAWRALRVVAAVRGRGRAEGLEAPFVGRDDELRLMKELYHATRREGRARLVSIVGPAGIGKSRLAWEFHKYLDGLVEQMFTHDGRSPAYGEGITFWALGEMIRERARLKESDDEPTTRRGIASMLEAHVPDEEERRWIEPAMLALLGFGDPHVGSEQLFAAWRTFFERLAEEDPVVLVFEELHHADPGLLDFIDHLLDWARSSPICVVTLARPELLEKRPEWGAGRRHFTSIYLEPLPTTTMRQLLDGLVPGLPEAAARQIVDRADGVPLYAVETVRMLVADGRLEERDGAYVPTGDIEQIAIPDSLTGLIAARLDALPPEQRGILQDASVLGQSFTTAALADVSGRPEETLDALLLGLVRREILTLRADPRSPERGQYAFVQALIREVAYNTLAKRDRKAKHLAAARHFESLQTDELVGALAQHYLAAHESAGEGPEADALAAQARIALKAAANRAVALGAHEQALGLFEDAMGISTDRAERAELALKAGESAATVGRHEPAQRLLLEAQRTYEELGDRLQVLRATTIWASYTLNENPEESRRVLSEAWQGSAELADHPVRIELTAQLARAHFFLDDTERAIELCDSVLPAAERHDLGEVIADVFITKGTALYNSGRAREALALLTGGRELALSVGADRTAVRAYINAAAVLDLDDPVASYESSRTGLALARRVGQRAIGYVLLSNAAVGAIPVGEWDWAADELARVLPETELEDRFMFGDPMVALAGLRDEQRPEFIDEILAHTAAATDPQTRALSFSLRAWDDFGAGRWSEAAAGWLSAAEVQAFGASESLTNRNRAAALARDPDALRDNLDRLNSLGYHGRMFDLTVRTNEAAIAALEGRHAEALGLHRSSMAALAELGARFSEAMVGLQMAWLLDPTDAEVRAAAERSREILVSLRAHRVVDWLDEAMTRGTTSAGRPAHGTAAEQVQVEVEDALP